MFRAKNSRHAVIGTSVLLSTLGWGNAAFAQDIYLEKDGIVAIEAETASAAGWQEHAPNVDDVRGKAMLSTGGDSICSSSTTKAKDFTPLEYHFRINKAGTYRLRFNIHKQVHCVDVNDPSQLATCHDGAKCVIYGVQSDGDICSSDRCWRADVSNDAFVNIVSAGGTPMKWVGGTADLTKLYGGSATKYAWSGNNALDSGGSKYAPDWDLPAGDYVLEVRNRSNGFSFDRLILVEAGASDADARVAEQSEVAVDSSPATGGASGSGGSDGAGTGGSATGGAFASGGSAAASGGSPGSGAPGSGGMTTEEMMEGTGSGDDSPASSGDKGSCAFGVAQRGAGLWPLALLLMGFFARRRRLLGAQGAARGNTSEQH